MARKFVGDIGKFRQALLAAGFESASWRIIFNDDSKAVPKQPIRRLKLWIAEDINNASQKKQWKLEAALRKAFGDRIITMYFIPGERWNRNPYPSLCIKLKDI
jgi:hypothetical protein